MKATLKQVTQEAMSLTSDKRSELSCALIQSLEQETEEDIAAIDEAWEKEIESGKVKGIPVEEVFAKLRAKYR